MRPTLSVRWQGDILKEVAEHMLDEGEVHLPEGFNHSRLVFLPKKPAGRHVEMGEYYLPEQTRPLSIVGTDNRILASAVKFMLHDYLERWVSKAQKGFRV